MVSKHPNEFNHKFNQGVLVSIGIHILIIIFGVVKVTYFNKPHIDLSQAIRVDIANSLPDKIKSNELPQKVQDILKEPPPVEEKKEEVVEEKPKEKLVLPKKVAKPDVDAVSLKKAKAKQKTALDKLKALNAIEKMKQEEKSNTPRKPVVVKGRVISAGSSLAGLDKLQADAYLEVLDSHIKQYWALPQWLMNKPFKTRILVKFDMNGRILSRQIVQPSGQPAYDDYCIQAIDQASPFPRFTEKFSEKYSEDGVIIGFPE